MSISMCTVEELTKTGIYCITQKSTGRKYIGSASKDFYRRWKRHLNDLNKLCHHSIFLQRAWDKYGCSDFTFEILEIWDVDVSRDSKQLLEVEQTYLDKFKPEFNMSPTANSRKGVKVSEETKEKIRLARKKQIMKPRSAEVIKKIAESNIGKHIASPETRKKMSDAKKGKPGRTPNNYILTSPDGNNITTNNLKKFCEENNLSSQNLFSVIRGTRKHSKGWKIVKL